VSKCESQLCKWYEKKGETPRLQYGDTGTGILYKFFKLETNVPLLSKKRSWVKENAGVSIYIYKDGSYCSRNKYFNGVGWTFMF
jgi:hypothetical protein